MLCETWSWRGDGRSAQKAQPVVPVKFCRSPSDVPSCRNATRTDGFHRSVVSGRGWRVGAPVGTYAYAVYQADLYDNVLTVWMRAPTNRQGGTRCFARACASGLPSCSWYAVRSPCFRRWSYYCCSPTLSWFRFSFSS